MVNWKDWQGRAYQLIKIQKQRLVLPKGRLSVTVLEPPSFMKGIWGLPPWPVTCQTNVSSLCGFFLTYKWIRTERFQRSWVSATEKCVSQLEKESRGCSSVAEHLWGINEARGTLDPRIAKQNKSITIACVKSRIQSPALKGKLRGAGHWRDDLMVNCSDILCVI